MEKKSRNPVGITKNTKKIILNNINMNRKNNFLKKLSKYNKEARALGYKWKDLIKKDTRQKIINEIKTQREIKIRVNKLIMENKELNDFVKKIDFRIIKTKKAFNKYTSTYSIKVNYKDDPLKQLNNTKDDIIDFLKRKISSMKGIKFNMNLQITFYKQKDVNLYEYKTAYFQSKPQILINNISINESYDIAKHQILTFIAQWISHGSGWIISSVDNLYINIIKYEPLKGSSYIELPIELRNSAKGLINIQNKDEKCFLYCHIRYLNPQNKYPQRVKKSDKSFINKLNYNGIDFPVNINQYNKIEKQNNININVFAYENKKPYPIYISNEKNENHIEMLLLTKNDKKQYVLIKDFNKFMFNQTKNRQRKHFCMSCLQCFSSERVLINHKNICLVYTTAVPKAK